MLHIRKWTDALYYLFFPHHCAGCGNELTKSEGSVCTRCYAHMPHTGFTALAGNPVEKIFYGRLPVQAAASAFYFSKHALLQRLIHQLKYHSRTDVGLQLGRWMGLLLAQTQRFNHIQVLVPMPLYPDKALQRGYNQATILCRGMAEILGLPIEENAIQRQYYTDSQTRKGRKERWLNVEKSFVVADADKLAHKHILLVDDVVTTGATLDACGQALRQIPGIGINIYTLATASED